MPIFIVLIGLCVYAVSGISSKIGKRKEPFTKEELEEIAKNTVGMSKEEAKRYIQNK